MKPGKPIPVRRTDAQSVGEMVRRLAYLAYFLAGGAGLGLAIAGLVAGNLRSGLVGGLLLALWLALHWLGRGRLRFGELTAEIRRNPFKPARPPDPDEKPPV